VNLVAVRLEDGPFAGDRVDHPYSATRRELTFEVGYGRFTRALELLLGTMNVMTLREIGSDSAEQARQKLASFVGPSRCSRRSITAQCCGRSCGSTCRRIGKARCG
jgi:hypothetical protein